MDVPLWCAKEVQSRPGIIPARAQEFMEGNEINVLPRPSRLSHKNGNVERSNRVFKMVVDRIKKADAKASTEPLSRARNFLLTSYRDLKR